MLVGDRIVTGWQTNGKASGAARPSKNGVLAGWIHRPAPGPEAAVKPSDLEFVLNAGTSGSQIVSNLFQEAQDLLLKKRGG